MTKTETLYSARQLADELGLTLQMLSIYAKCYSQMAKQQISKKGRLGRHFTEAQRQVIKNAREMVQQNTGVTVEEAMRKALFFDADALEPRLQIEGATIDLERLKQALSEAVTAPLIGEIQALRGELLELKQNQAPPQPRAENRNSSESADRQHSLIVRAALWLEQLLRR
jgi:hypothetical protein